MIWLASNAEEIGLSRQDPRIADAACERAFCTALADCTGHPLADVANLFGMLSVNLQHLVHSPNGWSALARIMVDDPGFCPQLARVH